MKSYVIFTDSACDISPALLNEWGVEFCSLSFKFSNDSKEYLNHDISPFKFYKRMREGGVAKTSAVNVLTFKESFEKILKRGQDILYLGFSGGLSTTCNSAAAAMGELRESYPERVMYALDTLSASAGFGMLLYLTVKRRDEGADIHTAYEYAKGLVPSICHWFTVEDLVYLRRGGRVGAAAALFGNMLGIKPVLHMDDLGHLVPVAKVRGRRSSVTALFDKYEQTAIDPCAGPVFISHGDALSDATLLANMITEKFGVRPELITDVGAVIGAHAGPGVLALFFVGKMR